VALPAVLLVAHAMAETNGFQLDDAPVPVDGIHPGRPVRDGIPSNDRPRFLAVENADFRRGEDQVLGIVRNGIARAYPIRIMNRQDIVNDDIAGERLAVTYCPLCGTGVAFAALSGTDGEVQDRIPGRSVTVGFDSADEIARAFDATGNQLPAPTGCWFACTRATPGQRSIGRREDETASSRAA
jgi:hypothetical protein